MCEHIQSTKMNSQTASGGLGCQNHLPLVKKFDVFFRTWFEKQINHLTFLLVSCLWGSQEREGVPTGRGGRALTCDLSVVSGVSADSQQQGIGLPLPEQPGALWVHRDLWWTPWGLSQPFHINGSAPRIPWMDPPCARPSAFQGQWPSDSFFSVPGGEESHGRTFNPKQTVLVEPVDWEMPICWWAGGCSFR